MLRKILQSLLFPKTIYTVDSPLSGRISVLKRGSTLRLVVGGLTQSVYVLDNNWKRFSNSYWSRAAEIVKDLDSGSPRGLVLGLGGGTFAHMVTHELGSFPLVGVEYDPEIVRVGRRYFGLNSLNRLQIVEEDALSYVEQQSQSSEKFSFILCDLFIGKSVVPGVGDVEFLEKTHDLLQDGGVVVFNWSHGYSTPADACRKESMLARVEEIFTNVESEVVNQGNCMLIYGRK